MEDRDNYFLIETVLTLLMIFSALSLFASSLNVLRLLISGIVIGGFFFSWTIRSHTIPWIRYAVNFACLGIFVWMVYAFLSSSLLYEEVVLISIKGLFFLIAALSFYVSKDNYLAYAQALSIPLFLCAPLTIKTYESLLVILSIGGYLSIWPVIIKMKFYRSFQREFLWDYKLNYALTAVLIIFLISLLSGWIFLAALPLEKISKGGAFLFSLEDKDLVSGMSVLEREYYRLQDELLSAIPDAVPFRETPEKKFALLGLLDYLIKQSSTIKEVDRARDGLVSYFNTPGAGIEKGEGERVEVLLKDYVDLKSNMNMQEKKEEIAKFLQDPLLLRERFMAGADLNKIQQSDSLDEISQAARDLQEYIPASALTPRIKEKILALVNDFLRWKFFQMQILDPRFEFNPDELRRILERPPAVPAQPPPEEKPVDSSPAKEERAASGPRGIIKPVFFFFLQAAGLILFSASILFFTVNSIIGKKKRRLLELYHNNPRAFIIDIYGHLKDILRILGFACPKHMPPLFYAGFIEKKCSIRDSLYHKFTEKFEEAKYSRHEVGGDDADLSFNQYHNLLKAIAGNYSRFNWFSKYWMILVQKKPLFINRG